MNHLGVLSVNICEGCEDLVNIQYSLRFTLPSLIGHLTIVAISYHHVAMSYPGLGNSQAVTAERSFMRRTITDLSACAIIWYGVHWQLEKCGQNVDNREFVRSLHIWGSESILFIWLGSDPSEICHTLQLHIEIETTQVLSALLDQYNINICWRKLIKATEKPTHYTFTSSYRNKCFRNI